MKNVMLKVDSSELKEGDILIWKNDRFIHLSKSSFLSSLTGEINELNKIIIDMKEGIKYLTLEVAKINAELAYNRGDITKERYEELCGLNK